MRNRSHPVAIRMSLLASVVLTSIASAALLHSVDPANAKPVTLESCQKKYRACVSRCTGRHPGMDENLACIKRTCNKQQDNCYASMGKGSPGGGKLALPPDKPTSTVGRGPFSPIGVGILDTSSGLPAQGPAATGSPMAPAAAPSAPPVVIR